MVKNGDGRDDQPAYGRTIKSKDLVDLVVKGLLLCYRVAVDNIVNLVSIVHATG